jgi:hypothetical protein
LKTGLKYSVQDEYAFQQTKIILLVMETSSVVALYVDLNMELNPKQIVSLCCAVSRTGFPQTVSSTVCYSIAIFTAFEMKLDV